MVAILSRKGRNIPVVVCDNCHETITDPVRSLACWDDGEDGKTTQIYHLHKVECDQQFNQGKHRSWQEMGRHMLYLTHNVGLSIETLSEVDKDAKELEQYGL